MIFLKKLFSLRPVSIHLGYKPKIGFLQKQIKRLPMLFDEEYFKKSSTIDTTEKPGKAEDQSSSDADSSALEELAMP